MTTKEAFETLILAINDHISQMKRRGSNKDKLLYLYRKFKNKR